MIQPLYVNDSEFEEKVLKSSAPADTDIWAP